MAPERRYWDTACFLAVLGNEAGRVDVCASILRAATVRELEIVTSAFTITEVLYPKGGERLSADLRDKVKRFFLHPGIVLVNVDRTVAERAQEACWDAGVRPKDAIHVASALHAGVPVFETYDRKLISLTGALGGNPPLQIREPDAWAPGLRVPSSFQGDLLDGD